jgi:glycosyltransferase involved in cell wall biosynthesis
MKVLFISHSSVVQSYQQKLCELAKYPGIEVHLLVPSHWNEANRDVKVSGPLCPRISLHVEKAYLVGRVGGYFFRPGSVRRLASRLKPDIIHIEEEPWSVACWQGIQAAKAVGAASIIFTWDNIWTRYRWISEKILKYTFQHASFIIAGNEEGKSLCQRRGFRGSTAVIPQYGVDEKVFDKREPSSSTLKTNFPGGIVGYVGRLETSKGIDILLKAIALLDDRVGGLILGQGSDRDRLVALAKELGISSRIIFRDSVPHDQIAESLNSLDILVLPSKTTRMWKEQFGRILVEAMACEVPVIGSDSGEIPTTIGDGGAVFTEGDHDDLHRKLEAFLASKNLREEIGRKGRARVLHMFTNERLASRLKDVYATLLSSGNPS